jgi:arylsulfatase A
VKPIPAFLCSLLLLCQGFAKDKQPNVVTLLVDDLGYRDLGCYGGPVKTPVLDKLAAGGVRFTDFHSGAPSCSPSRATFLTGRNHRRTGVYSVITERLHKMHLSKSETTIAEVLKENGYGTAHFGKWHLGMPVQNRKNPTPGDHGFDYWFGLVNGPGPSHKNPTQFLRNGKRVGQMKGYSCQIVVDEALTWLHEKRDDDEPFFLNLWFNEPHAPIAAPDEIVSQYGALNDQAAIYSGTIDNTDRAIGRLVAKLEQLGELDNTIIHYSSDNGSYRQERSGELRGQKGSLFEGGHRVPGIICWKGGIPGGRVEDEPAGAVDLLPTLCGLIGIEKPAKVHLDGSDLAPLLTKSGNFERHQPLFWMSEGPMVMRVGDHTLFASVTAKSSIDFKVADRLTEQIKEVLGDDLEKVLDGMDVKDLRSRLFNHGRLANPEADRLRNQLRDLYYFNEAWIPELKKSGIGRVQLYDLSKDLGQQNDIAKERPELVARLKKQAAAIHRSVMAEAPEWLTPEEQAAAKKPQEDSPDRPATGAPETDTAKLLARIDKNDIPKVYHGSRHQAYVDKVMAGIKPEQRARVGQLWKEKRRLDSDMSNPGASFVRILTYVAGEAGKSKSPNVVFLLADDLGWKDIGCYGGPVKTPALDTLAAKGMRFTDFHSGAAVCSTSRATILTGRHHIRAGLYSWIMNHIQHSHLLEREITLAEMLKAHGYTTAHMGKWHLGTSSGKLKKPTLNDHGFDYWFATANNANPSHLNPVNFVRNGKRLGQLKGYSCQLVVDEAIHWLEKERDPKKPFFLNLWFHEPHAPIAAPDELVKPYGPLKNPSAIYSGTIDNTDRAIARLLKKLHAIDKPENTIIIYSSDNGSYRHDRVGHLRGIKGSNYEGGIRVPGIFYWPGHIPSGRTEDEPSGLVDLLPTICGLVGINKPEGVHLDGADLSPLLTGKGKFKRKQHMAWISPLSGPALAIRDGDWSLCAHVAYEFPKDKKKMAQLYKEIEATLRRNGTYEDELRGETLASQIHEGFKDKEAEKLRGQYIQLNMFNENWIPAIKNGHYHRFELYNLAKDPSQKKNIAKAHPEVFNRLKHELLKINASVMADGPDWHLKENP